MVIYYMAIKLKNGVLFIALALLIFSGFTNYKLFKLNRQYRNALPYFLVGETIDYLELISANERYPDLNGLPQGDLSLIYIFPRISCLACDKNIVYLQKLYNILGDSVSMKGIALADLSEAYELSHKKDFRFPVYIPKDKNRFVEKFRIKINAPQILICIGSKVRYRRLGDLNSQAAVTIIELLKTIGGVEK